MDVREEHHVELVLGGHEERGARIEVVLAYGGGELTSATIRSWLGHPDHHTYDEVEIPVAVLERVATAVAIIRRGPPMHDERKVCPDHGYYSDAAGVDVGQPPIVRDMPVFGESTRCPRCVELMKAKDSAERLAANTPEETP